MAKFYWFSIILLIIQLTLAAEEINENVGESARVGKQKKNKYTQPSKTFLGALAAAPGKFLYHLTAPIDTKRVIEYSLPGISPEDLEKAWNGVPGIIPGKELDKLVNNKGYVNYSAALPGPDAVVDAANRGIYGNAGFGSPLVFAQQQAAAPSASALYHIQKALQPENTTSTTESSAEDEEDGDDEEDDE